MLKSHVQTSLRPLLDIPPADEYGMTRGDGYRHVEIRAYDRTGASNELKDSVQIHFGETHEARVIATFRPQEARELARYLIEAANVVDTAIQRGHR